MNTTPQELNHDSLATFRSDKDKNIRLSFGVFRSKASMTVFGESRQGGPLLKFDMGPASSVLFVGLLEKALGEGKGWRTDPLNVTEWDQEAKRRNTVGRVVIGRNEDGVIYVELANKSMQPTAFPVLMDMGSLDASGFMTQSQLSEIAVKNLIQVLNIDMRVARMLTSFKRDPSQFANKGAPGGNRGGYGGGGGNRSQPADGLNDQIVWQNPRSLLAGRFERRALPTDGLHLADV